MSKKDLERISREALKITDADHQQEIASLTISQNDALQDLTHHV